MISLKIFLLFSSLFSVVYGELFSLRSCTHSHPSVECERCMLQNVFKRVQYSNEVSTELEYSRETLAQRSISTVLLEMYRRISVWFIDGLYSNITFRLVFESFSLLALQNCVRHGWPLIIFWIFFRLNVRIEPLKIFLIITGIRTELHYLWNLDCEMITFWKVFPEANYHVTALEIIFTYCEDGSHQRYTHRIVNFLTRSIEDLPACRLALAGTAFQLQFLRHLHK